MSSSSFLYALHRYKPINTDRDHIDVKSKEGKRKCRLCDKAYGKFLSLRGTVLANAISVERELDRALAAYFVCHPSKDEERAREDQFIEIFLGSEGVSFNTKVEVLAAILGPAEIADPTPRKLRSTCQEIMKKRNEFAHRQLGIDWQTQALFLRDAKKRQWDPIPPDLETTYETQCREAVTLTMSIWKTLVSLRCEPSPVSD
jgi:hypothetical protein